ADADDLEIVDDAVGAEERLGLRDQFVVRAAGAGGGAGHRVALVPEARSAGRPAIRRGMRGCGAEPIRWLRYRSSAPSTSATRSGAWITSRPGQSTCARSASSGL